MNLLFINRFSRGRATKPPQSCNAAWPAPEKIYRSAPAMSVTTKMAATARGKITWWLLELCTLGWASRN